MALRLKCSVGAANKLKAIMKKEIAVFHKHPQKKISKR